MANNERSSWQDRRNNLRWTEEMAGTDDQQVEDEPYTMESLVKRPISIKSYHSEDWHDTENSISLDRKMSVAADLTHAVMFGANPHRQASGISLHEKSNFGPQESLDDMYIENLLSQGKKRPPPKENIRATMGFWKLIWFDFKHWYRRWKVKHGESVILKGYIKYMESNFGSAIGSFFVFTRWIMMLNVFLAVFWIGLVIFPVAINFRYTNITGHFAMRHLIDGEGLMTNSWFFYGSYKSELVKDYPMSLAYLFMVLMTYFGSLYIIIESITDKGEKSPSSTFKKKFTFSMMLWTSWDFSITSHEASNNLAKGIASAFKDNIYEAKALQDVKKRSRRENFKVYSLRALAWFITVVLIGGGCTAIFYVVLFMRFDNHISDQQTDDSMDEDSDFVSTYGTTLIFMVINSIVPLCIQQLPKFEFYASGKHELNITLTRIFFLRMANLFALISSLYNTVTKNFKGCAGTIIGQEMYKLVITDTILHSTLQPLYKFLVYYWTLKKKEFNMSSAVLVLVYRQALIWVGTLACPVLPFVGMLSNLAFFTVNYVIVSRTCKPPIKRWNQSRNSSFFAVFLLASLGMLILPASIIIGSSKFVNLGQTEIEGYFCGPFGNEKPTRVYTKFALKQADWLFWILDIVVSEPVLLPMFLILINKVLQVIQDQTLSTVLKHQYTKLGYEKEHCTLLQAELMEEREQNEKLIKKLQSMGISIETH